jgi:hypothetical protein
MLDNGGNYTYRARLKGGDTTPNSDTAAYRNGFLIVREGDLFDINDQDSPLVGDQFDFAGLAQETVRRPFPLVNAPASADTAFPTADISRIEEGVRLSGGISGFLGDLRDSRPLLLPHSRDVVFRGTMTASGGTELPNNQRIYYQPFNGRPSIIELQSNFITSQIRMESFYHPATGDERRVYFAARLSGDNVNSTNDSGIIFANIGLGSGFLSLREGDQVDQAPAGVLLGDLGSDNLIGGGGQSVLFNNRLTGPGISDENDWALIVSSIDRTTKITRALAQEGMVVR